MFIELPAMNLDGTAAVGNTDEPADVISDATADAAEERQTEEMSA